MRLIRLAILIFLLARFPQEIKQAVDIGSYFSKIIWILTERTADSIHGFYAKEVAPEVEKAKSVHMTKEN